MLYHYVYYIYIYVCIYICICMYITSVGTIGEEIHAQMAAGVENLQRKFYLVFFFVDYIINFY